MATRSLISLVVRPFSLWATSSRILMARAAGLYPRPLRRLLLGLRGSSRTHLLILGQSRGPPVPSPGDGGRCRSWIDIPSGSRIYAPQPPLLAPAVIATGAAERKEPRGARRLNRHGCPPPGDRCARFPSCWSPCPPTLTQARRSGSARASLRRREAAGRRTPSRSRGNRSSPPCRGRRIGGAGPARSRATRR